MLFKTRKTEGKAAVDQETIDKCLAKAISEGDMVNFRLLFLSFSPLRHDSSESIMSTKYSYLLPDEESGAEYREAKMLVSRGDVRAHVKAQLEKKGPAQLHADLLLKLADNAVRLWKLATAAQAYELLRVRRRMQEVFFEQADKALDEGDVKKAVKGYRIATGLEYDYAAFPEPLPAFPRFADRALMLHAEYPQRPEQSLALQAPEMHAKLALSYLLGHAEAANRLEARSLDVRIAFLEELIKQQDPAWQEFVSRYRGACTLVRDLGQQLSKDAQQVRTQEESLEGEIAEQAEERRDPRQVSEQLLGRMILDGEWWQYLKELANEHPAAILFVARQVVSKEAEIIMPRYLKDSPLVERLGLAA